MRKFIVIWLLFACVLSFNDRRQLPYGGAILRPNGELIPGTFFRHCSFFRKLNFIFHLSGAIARIWTQLFEDLYNDHVDRRGTIVVQNMIKYLQAIDLSLQNSNNDDLLPLLKKYQTYLNTLLFYIRDREIYAAVCEIIRGNIKVEQDFAKSGLDMNALNVYVKYSAVRLNNILIVNKRSCWK